VDGTKPWLENCTQKKKIYQQFSVTVQVYFWRASIGICSGSFSAWCLSWGSE